MLHILFFALTLIGSSILAIASHPSWSFILYEMIYFMNPKTRWWGYAIPDLGYSFLSVLLMGAVFAKGYSAHKKNLLLAAPQLKWMYFLLFLFVLSAFYAAWPLAAKDATINFIKLSVIISIAYKLVDSPRILNNIMLGFVYGGAYMSFLIFQVGRNVGDRVENMGPVDAPDSNGTAAAIAPATILALYFLWKQKGIVGKALAAVSGALLANAIVLINSRGSMLAIALGTAYFFWSLLSSGRLSGKQRRAVLGFILLGMFAVPLIVDQSAIDRLNSVKETEVDEEKESGATRVYFWLASLEMSLDYPFGTGYRGFELKAPEYLPAHLHTGNSQNRSVHSTWFQALSEVGYLGLFALVMMLFASFKSMRAAKRKLNLAQMEDDYIKVVAIEAALLIYIVAMSFMNRLTAEVLYWLILFSACTYNVYVVRFSEIAEQTTEPEPTAGKTSRLRRK